MLDFRRGLGLGSLFCASRCRWCQMTVPASARPRSQCDRRARRQRRSEATTPRRPPSTPAPQTTKPEQIGPRQQHIRRATTNTTIMVRSKHRDGRSPFVPGYGHPSRRRSQLEHLPAAGRETHTARKPRISATIALTFRRHASRRSPWRPMVRSELCCTRSNVGAVAGARACRRNIFWAG